MAPLVALTAGGASAQSTTFITGTVSDLDGKPVAHATVIAEGNNMSARGSTDEQGHFAFSGPAVGTYVLTAYGPGGEGSVRVDLAGEGAVVTIALLKVIGAVHVASQQSRLGSGTDVVLIKSSSYALWRADRCRACCCGCRARRAAQTASCTSTAITATSIT